MILFLTNNSTAYPLVKWLREKEAVILYSYKITVSKLEAFDPDIIVSYGYKHLIAEDVIIRAKEIINLHISYLPWNRGVDPNLWSFIDDTPKGVTIHRIDRGIDTGDILLRKELKFDETETLRSSYRILDREIQDLFKANWDKIRKSQLPATPQKGKGSYHSSKDSGYFGLDEPIYKLKQTADVGTGWDE